MLLTLFLKGEDTNKKLKTCGRPLLLGAPKIQKRFWVYVAAFWHKIVTTPRRYFLKVPLYCKILVLFNLQHFSRLRNPLK